MNEKIGAVTDKHSRRTFTLDEINEKNSPYSIFPRKKINGIYVKKTA